MTPARLAARIGRITTDVKTLALVHRGVDGQHVIAELVRADSDAENQASVFLLEAQQYADDIESRCEVAVIGLIGDRIIVTIPWVQQSREETYSTELQGTDEKHLIPSAQGQVTQSMRHSEATMRMLLNSLGGLLNHYKGALTDANTELRELRAESKGGTKKDKLTEEDRAFRREMMERGEKLLSPLVPALADAAVGFVTSHTGGAAPKKANGNGHASAAAAKEPIDVKIEDVQQ